MYSNNITNISRNLRVWSSGQPPSVGRRSPFNSVSSSVTTRSSLLEGRYFSFLDNASSILSAVLSV